MPSSAGEPHYAGEVPSISSPFTLAVCAEMVFTEFPFLDRVRRIRDLGYAVEIWDWTSKDLSALGDTGAQITSMTGYVEGSLTDDNGIERLLATAQQSIRAASQIGSPNLNLHGTGLGEGGVPVRPVTHVTEPMWEQAIDTLGRVAELGQREGVVFCLENLNTAVDHPGTPFARAEDTLRLVSSVDSPHLRMNLDLYHAQIGEGNLVDLIHRSAGYLGEVQVADVPGRCEPGTGEIYYPRLARALVEVGYTGVVGLEAFASADSEDAIAAFGAAFTL